MSNIEKGVFGTEDSVVSYIADRFCKTSSVPNVFIIFVIITVWLIRFLAFIFGKGIYGNVKTLFQAVTTASKTTVRNKTKTSESVSGTSSEKSAKPSGKGFLKSKSLARLGLSAKSPWRKYLNPWATKRDDIFNEPFNGEPLERMKHNKVDHSYDILDVLKTSFFEDEERVAMTARKSMQRRSRMEAGGKDAMDEKEKTPLVTVADGDSAEDSDAPRPEPTPAEPPPAMVGSTNGEGADSRQGYDANQATAPSAMIGFAAAGSAAAASPSPDSQPAKRKPKASAKKSTKPAAKKATHVSSPSPKKSTAQLKIDA